QGRQQPHPVQQVDPAGALVERGARLRGAEGRRPGGAAGLRPARRPPRRGPVPAGDGDRSRAHRRRRRSADRRGRGVPHTGEQEVMSQPPRNGTPSGNTPEGQEWYVLPPDRPSDADPSAGTSGAFGMPAQPPGGGAPAHGPYPQGGPADLPYGPHPGG